MSQSEDERRDQLVDELVTLADQLGLEKAVAILRESAKRMSPEYVPLEGTRHSAFGPDESGNFHV